MSEYNFSFDWARVTTLGKVKILVEQVVSAPSQAQIDAAVAQYIEDHPGAISGLSEAAKIAILQLAEKVVYIDEHGQDYYDDLYDAFYPPVELTGITAVYTQSGTVYDTDSLDSLKSDLVVTANYTDGTSEVVDAADYTLSGTLAVGTSTITAEYEGKTATFDVTVSEYIRQPLYNWDFTQSLTDSVGGQTAVLSASGVSQSSAGLSFTGGAGCCLLGTNVFPTDRTLEVDFASMVYNLTNHGRLIMFNDTSTPTVSADVGNGFILRSKSTPVWGFYKGSWSDSGNTDKVVFSGKTLKMKYYYSSSDSKYHTDVYCDDTLIKAYAASGEWNTTGISPVQIGSASNAYKNMVITGARIYEGVD